MSFHLAVALDAPSFSADYWTALARTADEARLDFVTLEDTFGPPAAGPARPDAVLVAARIAPLTSHIGLVPVATTTHTEPFHLSTALATLDYVSGGRAGWQARVSGSPADAALLGRRPLPSLDDLFDEAADAVEVVRRLWDSWADDAVIKDVATGRFIDRDKLHYIDFAGRFFRVKGPSIVPRPPQGQPVVAALAHAPVAYEFAARSADIVFVTPQDVASVASIIGEVRAAEAAVGRVGPPLKVFADMVVFLSRAASAQSDAAVFAGEPAQLAELLSEWHSAGVDGFRLRAGELPRDLELITRELVPLLPFRPSSGPLRERLGLGRAVNRYSKEAQVA
jgi:alkanesulfonate monooxygenase SsuD/methylene tetrahydromethanopterin reductase-like flavin-dependent oxidoreductase (luciferase family)